LIIGAAKCGTTSLHVYLGQHPDIFMSPVKEPGFFTVAWGTDQGWYEELFAEAGDARVRGEATPNYSKATEYPGTPAKIAAVVPTARLIYLIRDPVERVRSQYEHSLTPSSTGLRPQEDRPFSTAIRADPRYLDGSRYAFQIEQYLEHFPREQLLVLSSDRLRDDRRGALRQTFAFLAVDPEFWAPEYADELHRSDARVVPSRHGAGVADRLRGSPLRRALPTGARTWVKQRLRGAQPGPSVTVSEADREWMWNELGPDVQRLRAHVGPDFDLWGRA
jgi:hypothetical protein